MQEGQQSQTVAPVPQQTAPQSSWQFTNNEPALPQTSKDINPIQWSASEFIRHDKGIGWYLALMGASLLVAAGIYLITRDKITAATIIVATILLGVVAARKPRELQYGVDEHGVQIGKKLYPYTSFKSFSIMQEGGIESIWFMPMQRFMPGLSIYFAPEDGPKIVDALSQFLPAETRSLDPVDKFMHRIRF